MHGRQEWRTKGFYVLCIQKDKLPCTHYFLGLLIYYIIGFILNFNRMGYPNYLYLSNFWSPQCDYELGPLYAIKCKLGEARKCFIHSPQHRKIIPWHPSQRCSQLCLVISVVANWPLGGLLLSMINWPSAHLWVLPANPSSVLSSAV